MSYYKYAERDASAEVNWAQIGQNLTQTLQDEVKVREAKKAAIDAATREYDNTLNTAPQGEFQDGNKFTNDYVATQQKTRMMDDQLLKSGQMDLKTYTMRRQNGVDGTNQLFDLQKKFQSVYTERMAGIMSGELTAQNSFELSQVQGFGDFSKSQALVNPVDGRVNIGMTEIGPDGVKRVVANSNIPVNVLMGKIQTPLAAFKANEATKALVDAQGERVYALFKAGTLAGAGSITELTGIDAIDKFGKGEWVEAAREMNNAIKLSVDSMLANPRNLPSLLTGQVGGYSGESFTYDKNVAAKDATKILLKPSMDGSPGVMDENGPNYAAQKKQAEEWLTVSIKSQMDAKVGKKEINQAQLQETAEAKERAASKYRPKAKDDNEDENAAGAWNQLYTGKTPEEKKAAAEILLGTPNAIKAKLQSIDLTSVPGSVVLKYEDASKNRTISMKGNSLFDFSSQGVELHGVVDRKKAFAAGGGGKGYGDLADFSGVTAKRQGQKKTLPTDIVSMSSQDAVNSVSAVLPTGFKAEDTGNYLGVNAKSRNQVTITAPNGKKYIIQTGISDTGESKKATTAVMALEDFINDNTDPNADPNQAP
jgi:hypothetical protein